MKSSHRVAKPLDELAVPSAKEAANCITLHLANKNLTELGSDFCRFVSLESLWLNNNEIKSLAGLSTIIRLRCLYLHHNNISDLSDGELRNLKYLNELTLNNNKLHDLSEIIDELRCLKHLTLLNLFGNPCAQEDNYRLQLIGSMPQLLILDRHRVTDEERCQAQAYLKKLSSIQATLLHDGRGTIVNAKEFVSPDVCQARDTMKKNLTTRIKTFLTSKRIFLEDMMMSYDVRGSSIISYDRFYDVLHSVGIHDISEDEVDMISKLYGSHTSLPSHTRSGNIDVHGIDYHRFCHDMLPHHMRFHTSSSDTPHHEVSDVTRSLIRYVKTCQLNSNQHHHDMTSSSPPSSSIIRHQIPSSSAIHGLDAWEAYEISKILSPYDDKMISIHDMHDILLKIKIVGKEQRRSDEELMLALLNISSSDADDVDIITLHVNSIIIRQAFGCHKISSSKAKISSSTPSSMKISSPSSSKSSSSSSVTKLSSSSMLSPSSMKKISSSSSSSSSIAKNDDTYTGPMIMFYDVNPASLVDVEKQSFDDATMMMDKILRADDKHLIDDDLQSKTISSSIIGSKLMTADHRLRQIKPKPLKPDDIMLMSSSRCDMMIIPNLNSRSITSSSFDELAWRRQLQALGMDGEKLELAVNRKRRTDILKQQQLDDSKAMLSPSSSISDVLSRARTAIADHHSSTSASMTMNKTKSSIKKKYTWEKGWGANTGTVVFNNAYVPTSKAFNRTAD